MTIPNTVPRSASVITSAFKENGQNVALDISYAANATDVQSQVLAAQGEEA